MPNPSTEPTVRADRRPLRLTAIALSSAAVGALAVGMTSVEAQNPPVTTGPATAAEQRARVAGLCGPDRAGDAGRGRVTTKRGVGKDLVGGQQEFPGNPEEFRGSSARVPRAR